ncbi:hypothetical protein PkP19E3_33800 (plasmid) [Pseudomonas koreensis]|nr:hypothetical protein PkP19E3_33800 [Pseudomonas koreensis]
MQKMANEYRAGPQAPAVLTSGETVSIGTVLKAEIDMTYIVSTIQTDGKKIAFDIRELQELADVFEGVGRSRRARLSALANRVAVRFSALDDFHNSIAAIGIELAS